MARYTRSDVEFLLSTLPTERVLIYRNPEQHAEKRSVQQHLSQEPPWFLTQDPSVVAKLDFSDFEELQLPVLPPDNSHEIHKLFIYFDCTRPAVLFTSPIFQFLRGKSSHPFVDLFNVHGSDAYTGSSDIDGDIGELRKYVDKSRFVGQQCVTRYIASPHSTPTWGGPRDFLKSDDACEALREACMQYPSIAIGRWHDAPVLDRLAKYGILVDREVAKLNPEKASKRAKSRGYRARSLENASRRWKEQCEKVVDDLTNGRIPLSDIRDHIRKITRQLHGTVLSVAWGLAPDAMYVSYSNMTGAHGISLQPWRQLPDLVAEWVELGHPECRLEVAFSGCLRGDSKSFHYSAPALTVLTAYRTRVPDGTELSRILDAAITLHSHKNAVDEDSDDASA